MDLKHLQAHLADMTARIDFLRAMQPDSPAYRLWLGDVVEIINLQWGVDSEQMATLRAALAPAAGAGPAAGPAEAAGRAYLDRLNRLQAALESLRRSAGTPIQLVDWPAVDRQDGNSNG